VNFDAEAVDEDEKVDKSEGVRVRDLEYLILGDEGCGGKED